MAASIEQLAGLAHSYNEEISRLEERIAKLESQLFDLKIERDEWKYRAETAENGGPICPHEGEL